MAYVLIKCKQVGKVLGDSGDLYKSDSKCDNVDDMELSYVVTSYH